MGFNWRLRINVEFTTISKYMAGRYRGINYNELNGYWSGPVWNAPTFWGDAELDLSASLDPFIINMWFTDEVDGFPTIAGFTKPQTEGGDGVVIFKAAFSSGYVIDTIAHELGHVLGLEHATTDPYNLMYDTSNGHTLLTEDQATVARSSTFLKNITPVPEPATMFLFGLGLLSLAGVSRKKQK